MVSATTWTRWRSRSSIASATAERWLAVLVGADAPPVDGLVELIRATHADVDVEAHEGGQPHYPLLLVAEYPGGGPIRPARRGLGRLPRSRSPLLGRVPDRGSSTVAMGGSAGSACAELEADVAVIDYRLPGWTGRGGSCGVRARCPRASVVFLSASAGEDELRRATASGAALVRKDEGLDALVEAVRAARGGRGEPLAGEHRDRPRPRPRTTPMPGALPQHAVRAMLYVRFGDETYRDYVELGPAEFFEKLRSSLHLPATSQPTPQDFLTAYENLAGYERIYSPHVSSKPSGTFQSAELAAQELGGDRVRVVDSRTASLAIALLAHAIQRRLTRGTRTWRSPPSWSGSTATARSCSRSRPSSSSSAAVGSAAPAALAGSLLNVRPILAIEDGDFVLAVARVRGHFEGTGVPEESASRRRPRTRRDCASRSRTPTRPSGSAR